MPKKVLASVGFDALCHCMEAYTSKNAQPFTDALCEYAMRLTAENLVRVYKGQGDTPAWEKLTLASTIGGMVINTAGVTLAHGMEHPASGLKNIVHGQGLAALTPAVIEASQKGNPEKFRKDTSVAVLYKRFTSDKEGLMRIGFAADWNFDIYLNGTHCLKAQGPTPLNADSNFHDFHIRKGENILAAVVRAGSRGWGFLCAKPRDPVVFREGKTWKPYRDSALEIIPGSALDLSAQNDAPAGKYGPAVLSPDGKAVFKHAPEQTVRLLGFNTYALNGIMTIKDNGEFKAAVRRFAQAAKRQGYNLFRMHGFDEWVMTGSRKDQKPLPRYMDRWDRMVYEMKRQGIYLQLNIRV